MQQILDYLDKRPYHKYTREYLDMLFKACGEDYHSLRLLIAVSRQETVLGSQGHGLDGHYWINNFWGWYLNGNRSYDPDPQTMAKAVCVGFSKGGRYYTLMTPDGENFNWNLAKIYSGNDRLSAWFATVSLSYKNILEGK